MKIVTSAVFQGTSTLSTVVLASTSLVVVNAAIAHAMPTIQVDSDGSVQVDSNAFDLSTGPNRNSSNIPMPRSLIQQREEGVAQPVRRDQLAPNSIEFRTDADSINRQLQPLLPGFEIREESLRLSTQFELQYIPGDHGYGEGIQVAVYGPDGSVKTVERGFVRGDIVRIGPDGQALPRVAQITAVYGTEDTVELRVLNIQRDGGQPRESGVYFTTTGELAVEDLPGGGDLDFDDGNYFELSGGQGATRVFQEVQAVSDTVTYRTEIVETPLMPLLREEQIVDERSMRVEQTFTEVEEEREFGYIENDLIAPHLLPHAAGISTADDEQLVYSQYTDAAQVRLGSDGASLVGQLPPLVSNPDSPPTLLTGSLQVDPTVEDNRAGINVTLGLTQFLAPTHRAAIDMYGQTLVNPDLDGPTLLQPTGLINNTRLVGFVPPTPEQTVPGDRLSSIDGVFDLPDNQTIIIAPPEPDQVGSGDSAYLRNVGGLIVVKNDGTLEFVPQWNQQGYLTEPFTLTAGSARQVIYALVPQQADQNLQLGQSYAVLNQSANGYQILDGGYQIIAANQYPENFRQELLDVYAVEDTLAGKNFSTERFNGIRGSYRQVPGGPLISTFDVTQPDAVDARVGNQLSTPDTIIPADPGQTGYFTTTVAGGLYVRGALAVGLGNQRDSVTTTTSTLQGQVDVTSRQVTTNVFATPQTQVETRTTELINRTSETRLQTGRTTFDIDADGILSNIDVQLNAPVITSPVSEFLESPTVVDTSVQLGTEYLASSITETSTDAVLVEDSVRLVDQQITVDKDAYPNFSPVIGELAVGGVLNLGQTPWTPAANTVRAELFAQATVLGRENTRETTGWRVEAVINPFGEEHRPAYSYDQDGTLTPIYQTQLVLDEDGNPVMAAVTDASGQPMEVETSEFVLNEAGERIPQTVGTGRPVGPKVYLRVEDVFARDEGVLVDGGLTFDF
ncbi:hypothetical protein PN498_08635 [Oscillatoria sp. CS-180]|uniref:hypothetical protein n=1 Tax=Oscillatoria sp. CS-180 TaxID=3021720 RepID=UPI00232E0D27|nr:hypothetical protein [Oscillatoria sp. CS-180]MDB9526050.1 hypothetical protein [Oscillatoria sp. CS-180]